MIMQKKNKLVCGVGINDADYVVALTANGKQVRCPFYSAWKSMLERCYSVILRARRPTYIGCSVVPEWHSFMVFKRWMEQQDWQGKHLDKDLLIEGNKVYGPETCVFVGAKLNNFTIDRGAARGQWPLGVSLCGVKYRADCKNPFNENDVYLGHFTCPHEAHEAWRKRKHELACLLADEQTDQRIAKALRERYAAVQVVQEPVVRGGVSHTSLEGSTVGQPRIEANLASSRARHFSQNR